MKLSEEQQKLVRKQLRKGFKSFVGENEFFEELADRNLVERVQYAGIPLLYKFSNELIEFVEQEEK